MPQIEKRRPEECSTARLEQFTRLVIEGGEVPSVGLNERIKRAKWLVFAFDERGTLAGVGALKRPTLAYTTKIFNEASCCQVPEDFQFEVGWIFVDPKNRGRGYSRLIVKAILEAAGPANMFATTKTDNVAMKKTLYTCGFTEVGQPFQSAIRDQTLALHICPASPK